MIKKLLFLLSVMVIAFAVVFILNFGADAEQPIESIQFDIPETHLIGGFAVGVQAYTFNPNYSR